MRWLAAVALSAALGACAAPSEREPIEAVRARVQALIEANNRRDLDAVVECFCEDAVLYPPRGEGCTGREAIRARYADIFANWRPKLGILQVTTFVEGDRAVDQGGAFGTLTPIAGGADRTVDDEYRAVLRREGSAWRVAELSWRPHSGPMKL